MYFSTGRSCSYHLNRTLGALRTNCCSSSFTEAEKNAKVIYSVASALAHNMDGKPAKYKSRVPAILSDLQKANLTPKFRGSEITQLQNIRSAAMEHVTCVHTNNYLFHLDRAIRRAAEGNTSKHDLPERDLHFVTVTTLDDSLVAAGACLSVIDSVDPEYDTHSGKIDDIGPGNAEGTTLNMALPTGSGDMAMRTVFDEVIVPSVQRFKPDIILVSAGYDGHAVDPMGKFQMSTKSYYMLASGIKQLAKDLCGGRCVFILAGASIPSILSFSVAECFRGFIEEPSMAPEFEKKYAAFFEDEPSYKVKEAIERVKSLHSL